MPALERTAASGECVSLSWKKAMALTSSPEESAIQTLA